MQGMNFDYNSTYIQNTNQESIKSFSQEIPSESGMSFMQMINSVQGEFSNSEKINFADTVHETDREVNTNLTKAADSEIKEYSDKSARADEVAAKNTDVSKEEKKSAESDVADVNPESGKSKAADILAELLNSSDKKNHINDAESKSFAAKKALNTFKNVNSAEKSNDKIAVLKERVDDEKLKALIENAKDFKTGKKVSDDAELLAAANLMADKKVMSDGSLNLNEKTENSSLMKDFKIKKVDKKLSDVISVTDLRTQKPEEVSSTKKSQLTTTIKQTGNNSATVTMDLSGQAAKNILSLDSQTAGSQGSNFQAMLENQIFENSADFVKAGKIVLKDNDVGNIDLILHPQSLGNVKISLELSDKVITGKILVSSQEALEAFNATQESLKAAFIESGFDGASFDVSFANQNQDFAGNQQSQQDNSRQAHQSYGNYVVENTLVEESNSDIYNDERSYSLNVVA